MPLRPASALEKLDSRGPLVGQRQAGVAVPLGAGGIGLLLDSGGLAAVLGWLGAGFGWLAVLLCVFGCDFWGAVFGWLAAIRFRS